MIAGASNQPMEIPFVACRPTRNHRFDCRRGVFESHARRFVLCVHVEQAQPLRHQCIGIGEKVVAQQPREGGASAGKTPPRQIIDRA